MSVRIEAISRQFLERPYELTALGDGGSTRYDEAPLYRLDAFDCETFVTTVLALSIASNFREFKNCLLTLRYQEGKPDFLARNHFTALDWNETNQKKGLIKDITTNIKGKNNRSIALTAVARIDKPAWYAHLNSKVIRITTNNPVLRQKRLDELKLKGSKLKVAVSRIAYLPLDRLFDKQGNPDESLFKQIPNASIIEIVRPNWNLETEIGTHLNVSHLGFAFWRQGELLFRQASSQANKVIDVPLIAYLKDKLTSPTIKGINVQVPVPEKPMPLLCQLF